VTCGEWEEEEQQQQQDDDDDDGGGGDDDDDDGGGGGDDDDDDNDDIHAALYHCRVTFGRAGLTEDTSAGSRLYFVGDWRWCRRWLTPEEQTKNYAVCILLGISPASEV